MNCPLGVSPIPVKMACRSQCIRWCAPPCSCFWLNSLLRAVASWATTFSRSLTIGDGSTPSANCSTDRCRRRAGWRHATSKRSASISPRWVPLDDVLAFRQANLVKYKEYMRGVHRFVTDLSAANDLDKASNLEDRREVIIDAAAQLRATARSEWKQPFARFAIGAAGAAWTLKTGDPTAAIFGGLAAILEFEAPSANDGPFSYLLAVENTRW